MNEEEKKNKDPVKIPNEVFKSILSGLTVGTDEGVAARDEEIRKHDEEVRKEAREILSETVELRKSSRALNCLIYCGRASLK